MKQVTLDLSTKLPRTGKGIPEEFDGAFFFAWCSLYQPYHKKHDGMYRRMPNPQLTDAQRESHQKALENMDIWYTHQQTEVWMITKTFDGQGKPYDERGW